MQKIWINGAGGQLGKAINQVVDPRKFEILNTDKDEVDITDIDEVIRYGEFNRPDVIINCTGYTDLDLCEENPEKAYKVNAIGARNLSIIAKRIDAKLVHASTDDVFDGRSMDAYTEFDLTNPHTIYGKSKLAGEQYVKEFTSKHFIVRSTWVYGDGKNFIRELLAKAKESDTIAIASDQYGSPTSAIELAKFILFIIGTNEYGTYHATCKGECSRYSFAKEALAICGIKDVKLKAVPSHEAEFSQIRPAYAVLDNFILRILDDYDFPDWKSALKDYLKEEMKNGK